MQYMPARAFVASLAPDALGAVLRGEMPRVKLTPKAYAQGSFLSPRQARRRKIRNQMAGLSRRANRG